MPYLIEAPQAGLVVVKLQDELTIEEIAILNATIVAEYLQTEKATYIIYDVAELRKFPTSIPKLQQASTPIATHKAVKMQIITGVKNPVFSFLFDVIGQLFKQSLKKFNTLDDALSFIDTELHAKT